MRKLKNIIFIIMNFIFIAVLGVLLPSCGYIRTQVIDDSTASSNNGGSGSSSKSIEVISVTSTNSPGIYGVNNGVGSVIQILIQFSEPIQIVGGAPQLSLNTGRVGALADYISGSGTSTLVFKYTVVAGDNTSQLDCSSPAAIQLNGASLNNLSGSALILTPLLPVGASQNSLPSNALIVIDAVAPTITTFTVTNSPITATTSYGLTFTASETPAQYCILENSTNVSNCSWQNPPLPTTFLVSTTNNAKVLSAWVRDAAGNVSARADSNTVTLNTSTPNAPSSLSLVTPSSSPGRLAIPIISVSGVTVGDTITLYTSSSCLVANSKGSATVTSGTSLNVTSTALASDGTYIYYAKTVNNAGTPSSCSTASLSYHLDTVAPTTPSSFFDGLLGYYTTTTPLFTWNAGSDADSGIQSYQVAIGDVAGGTNVLGWTDVGNVLSATMTSLNLQGSRRYYPSIKSIDVAGNASSITQGDGWWNFAVTKKAVDTTTPVARSGSDAANFGYATALSEDGSTLVVGAANDSLDADGGNSIIGAGAVFVYIRSGGNWVFQQKLTGVGANSRGVYDAFGSSVAISGDTIIVGAYNQDYDEAGANLVADAGAAYVFTRTTGVWSQQQKLVGVGTNGRGAYDLFGSSVSISGDTIVVGAYDQDYDETGSNMLTNAGAAYVFTRTTGVWSLQQKLVGTGVNGRMVMDAFGASVAIGGDTIVVGAFYQAYDPSGSSFVAAAGAAYVFTRTLGLWSLQQKLIGSGTNGRLDNDYFGISVAISGDTAVVGAYGQAYDASGANLRTFAGAVYVFTRTTGVWSLQQKLVGTGVNGRTASDSFGYSVAINVDTIVVGAYTQDYDETGASMLTNAGAAYVFTRTTGVWSLQQKLVGMGVNGRMASDQFGIGVAISGNTIVIGAANNSYDENGSNQINGSGAAYGFSRLTTTWSLEKKLVDTLIPQPRMDLQSANLGTSIAISEDGSTLVVGVPNDDTDSLGNNFAPNAGAAYVYFKTGGSWVLQQKLIGVGINGRITGDNFGQSVSISGDTIVIGATSQSYDENGANYSSAAGAAYVFIRTTGVWSLQQKLVGIGTNSRVGSDYFGYRVSISGDSIVVGAYLQSYDAAGANYLYAAGAAFVYTRTTGVWSLQQKLVGSGVNGRMGNDYFGYSVFISGDTIAVGASGQGYDSSGANLQTSAGAVYVFTRTVGVWSLEQKLIGSGVNGRNAFDSFGCSVSVSLDTIVIGTTWHSYDANGANSLSNAGAAFVFTRTAGVWSLQQKLVGSGINGRMSNDQFGISVSINGDTIAVGANSQSYDAVGSNMQNSAGAVYLYSRVSSVWSLQQKLVGAGVNGRMTNDHFGTSVAVSENGTSDGYTIGIGAPGQQYSSSGANPVSDAGALFIYY